MSFYCSLAGFYSNYRIIIILDKTGWHISHILKLSDNIQLLPLNPYSPEQNPVELLWREIRRKYFHNNIFNSIDDVEDTLQGALKNYHANSEAILKLSKSFL